MSGIGNILVHQFVRRIRDEQAALLEGKTAAEIMAFFLRRQKTYETLSAFDTYAGKGGARRLART